MNEITNILIMDDSEDDVILMIHHIKQMWSNFNYTWVDTKDKLLKELDDDTNWNIIICDVVLPQFSGPEAVVLIRKKSPRIPIICVSGSSFGTIASQCLECGAEAFINKANLEDLAAKVKEILSKKK